MESGGFQELKLEDLEDEGYGVKEGRNSGNLQISDLSIQIHGTLG